MLSDNYTAVAQTVNLLAEWLIQAGMAQYVSESDRGILLIGDEFLAKFSLIGTEYLENYCWSL